MLRPSRRRDRKRSPRQPLLITALALSLGAVVVVVVGVAAGAGSYAPVSTPQGVTYPNEASPATAASAEARAAFGILRRDAVGDDAFPAQAAQALAGTYTVKVAGLNAALARRASTDTGAVWVIPGNGQTCLVVNARAVPPGGTDLADDAATCAPDAEAASGKLVTSIQYNADKPPYEFIAGLVPDGVRAVTVQTSDGSSQTLPVHDNVYTAAYNGLTADSATFAGPSGDVIVKP